MRDRLLYAFFDMTWRPSTRVLFRFCFSYFGLFSLASQISGSLIVIPFVSYRGLGILWPMREITMRVGRDLLGIRSPMIYEGNSRDMDFFWVQTLWLLVVAIAGTAAWSVMDRRRENYIALHKWFRLFIRFALASQMFEYGMTKLIPVQFPSPSLTTLVTPVGNLSLSGLLWTSIGASHAYEIFTGCAELLGGILLVVPRTTTIGALISLADMIQVFVLNMAYDIGVKQVSFHLILLAVFLLAPDFRRLADFFFLNRAAEAPNEPALGRTPRANRIALAMQVVLGAYLLAIQADVNWVYWYAEGGGKPKSGLYGIWEVEQLAVNGQARPAALNDYDRRWRRVIFDSPDAVAFQRTDDSFARYGVSIDDSTKTLSLTKGKSRTWRSQFRFDRPREDRLVLDGQMDGLEIQMQLQRVEFDTFRLLNSSFRWVRPPD